MLAARRNGLPDADRLEPIAVVGDTLWMDRALPGFGTAGDVVQQTPPLQDTLRDTQPFNQGQAPKEVQAEEAEQQQQNERQPNAMRPRI
ncbi:hypothetical protein ACFQ4Q_02535 [Lysobacter gummosus]|uniref:hypothetical protein n=1 Tax=Lysobacter gummosus TaxID=262324 RepID=UPI00363FF18A